MEKLFYQYKYMPAKEPVKGVVIDETETHYMIQYGGGSYMILKHQTRDPWEPHVWEFYKSEGFYMSPWFHGGFIAWFFIFVY